jgi:hypothetical protein
MSEEIEALAQLLDMETQGDEASDDALMLRRPRTGARP